MFQDTDQNEGASGDSSYSDTPFSELTTKAKQFRLSQEVHRYIKGEISEEKLEEAEEELDIDYAEVALKQVSVIAEICNVLRNSFSKFKQ